MSQSPWNIALFLSDITVQNNRAALCLPAGTRAGGMALPASVVASNSESKLSSLVVLMHMVKFNSSALDLKLQTLNSEKNTWF
jgi:hypothetical protein